MHRRCQAALCCAVVPESSRLPGWVRPTTTDEPSGKNVVSGGGERHETVVEG